MEYSEFVECYEKLDSTTKRLEKTQILADFFKVIEKNGEKEWSYLLFGRVLPDYDPGELGISKQLAIKAISKTIGIEESKIEERYNKIGDLGEIAEELVDKRKQKNLFSAKLTVKKVFEGIKKLMDIEGKGSVDKKMDVISELIGNASGKEAKYIVRTLLSDLRIGVAKGVLVDALASAYFSGENREKIEESYDIANDLALVFEACYKNKLDGIEIKIGRPMNVMLAVKAEDISEAFEICGKPAAFEYKYDGFRMVINKDKEKISLFTRKLENVTNQFPDVVEAVRKNIQGDNFILDSEVVGYDPKTGKYKPFEAISQRIKRKYDIDLLIKQLPVEVNVFDVIYYNKKSAIDLPFLERRKIVEKIVNVKEKVIKPSEFLVTDSYEKAQEFYEEALKVGEEGVMVKKVDAPYKQGRKVGYMVKVKPIVNDLDLVVVGAEYGSGKRAGWLTSFIVACKNGKEFLEVGMVSSGLKEKEEEGTSYNEMTELLKPLILGNEGNMVRVKPRIIVSVTYQNIQKSPSYSSGYAMRFPRITRYRPDKNINEVADIEDIKAEAKDG